MPTLPLTFIETRATKETVEDTEVQGDETGLPLLWASALYKLKDVCEQAAKADRQQRLLVTQACQQIARHVGEAGFQGQELPRDYEVRRIDRHWVMVKCFPPLRSGESCSADSDSAGQREVRFVASGEESLWTRFNLQVSGLTDSQVKELVVDLETGLIGDIVAWVQARTSLPPISGSTPNQPLAPEGSAVAPTESNHLRLVDLGRSKRRNVRIIEEPMRRTA